jgi:glyoxylase-like metal-dependent hydrolase (beta-lactamase superfamily II)
MKLVRLVTLGLTLSLLAGSAQAQSRFDDVEITATRVAGNVYMLKGAGGNIGVSVGEDGILIVDDQFEPLADKIRAALREIGGGELAFVLNTHWHGDHTSGNAVFGAEAPIIAHRNVRRRLSTTQDLTRRTYEPSPKDALPVITFNDSLWIHFNGEDIRAIHFPQGHTDGDIVVFFPQSNVVHIGDILFSGLFPFVDLETGGDVQKLIGHVETLLVLIPTDAMIIPGHGPLSTHDDLRNYHEMLLGTTEFVRSEMTQGKTLEELQARGLAEEWAEWSWNFIPTERWIETIYRSYVREQDGRAE